MGDGRRQPNPKINYWRILGSPRRHPVTLYRAILQFEQGGPAVTDEWHDEAVARAAYKTGCR